MPSQIVDRRGTQPHTLNGHTVVQPLALPLRSRCRLSTVSVALCRGPIRPILMRPQVSAETISRCSCLPTSWWLHKVQAIAAHCGAPRAQLNQDSTQPRLNSTKTQLARLQNVLPRPGLGWGTRGSCQLGPAT